MKTEFHAKPKAPIRNALDGTLIKEPKNQGTLKERIRHIKGS